VEFEYVLDGLAILGVLLHLQHVHEGAVVYPVHAERPDEIPFHQPERLGKQERIRHFGSDPVYYLAPELLGHGSIELLPAHPVLGAGRDSMMPGLRIPEALIMLLGKRHGSVETDDRKHPRHMEYGADDRLSHLRIQVVELGGIVPGGAGTVIAVVDEAGAAVPVVVMLEHHCSIAPFPVAVLDMQADLARR